MTTTEFEQYIERYAAHLRPTIIDNSIRAYMVNLRAFLNFAELLVGSGGEITLQTIAEFLTYLIREKELNPYTARIYRGRLNYFFNYCVAQKFIEINPIDLRKLPKLPPARRVGKQIFSKEMYNKLVLDLRHRTDTDWHDAAIVGYNTGLRLSDMACLKWTDFDWNGEFLTLIPRKTKRYGKEILVPMSPELFEVLNRRKNHPDDRFLTDDYVFPAFKASYEQSGHNLLKSAFIYRCRRAGLENVSYHCLRHTFVTRMLEGGANYGEVGKMTGQSLKTIQGYHHVSLDSLRKAITKAA